MTALPELHLGSGSMTKRSAVIVFTCFAFAYFFSALVRGVTATLAPNFSAEIGLNAADLGLLAGAYFFGFAAMQLPIGSALDRFGLQGRATADELSARSRRADVDGAF